MRHPVYTVLCKRGNELVTNSGRALCIRYSAQICQSAKFGFAKFGFAKFGVAKFGEYKKREISQETGGQQDQTYTELHQD